MPPVRKPKNAPKRRSLKNPTRSRRSVSRVLNYMPPITYGNVTYDIKDSILSLLEPSKLAQLSPYYNEEAYEMKIQYIRQHLNIDRHFFVAPVYQIVNNMVSSAYGMPLEMSVARNNYILDDAYADEDLADSYHVLVPANAPREQIVNALIAYRRLKLTTPPRTLPTIDEVVEHISSNPSAINEVYNYLRYGRIIKKPMFAGEYDDYDSE